MMYKRLGIYFLLLCATVTNITATIHAGTLQTGEAKTITTTPTTTPTTTFTTKPTTTSTTTPTTMPTTTSTTTSTTTPTTTPTPTPTTTSTTTSTTTNTTKHTTKPTKTPTTKPTKTPTTKPSTTPNTTVTTTLTTTATTTPTTTPTTTLNITPNATATTIILPNITSNTRSNTTDNLTTNTTANTTPSTTQTISTSTEANKHGNNTTTVASTKTSAKSLPSTYSGGSTTSLKSTTSDTSTIDVKTSSPSSSQSSTPTHPPSRASSPSSSQSSPPTHPPSRARISETNILLTEQEDKDVLFVELEGIVSDYDTGLTLVIRDVYHNTLLSTVVIDGQLVKHGILVVGGEDLKISQEISGIESIMLSLYQDEMSAATNDTTGLLDLVVYATYLDEHWSTSPIREAFRVEEENQIILISKECRESLKVKHLSLSRCSIEKPNNSGIVLTAQSRGEVNSKMCSLDFATGLQIKLIRHSLRCGLDNMSPTFNKLLTSEILKGVNTIRQCGFTGLMLQDMIVESHCIENKKTDIPVKFNLKASFEIQMDFIKDTFVNFVMEHEQLSVNGIGYTVSNCTKNCFSQPDLVSGTDDSIHMTIAVVLSCIAVFVVISGMVIFYMKRKRRGILQFRMTRLDEDDDDLIGDMDDFVGSQGPTFHRYR